MDENTETRNEDIRDHTGEIPGINESADYDFTPGEPYEYYESGTSSWASGFHENTNTGNETLDRGIQNPGSVRRNIFNEAATLVNRGGIGRVSYTHNNHTHTSQPPTNPPPSDITLALDAYEKQFYPHQPKSFSGIALRSFILGMTLTLSLISTIYLSYLSYPLWRAPFFIFSLSAFHFLEFYTTSLTNIPSTSISSFLLASNGSAYTIAHTASFLETLISHLFLPSSLLPTPLHHLLLALGLTFIILGQAIRSTAMYQAGPSFTHIVAHTRRSTHTLITHGLYSILRHPSYFGYFWWAIGTQLVCGNGVCLVAYAVVLWRFFQRRIGGEEELLVGFFGDEYREYRKRTWVGIPGIW